MIVAKSVAKVSQPIECVSNRRCSVPSLTFCESYVLSLEQEQSQQRVGKCASIKCAMCVSTEGHVVISAIVVVSSLFRNVDSN